MAKLIKLEVIKLFMSKKLYWWIAISFFVVMINNYYQQLIPLQKAPTVMELANNAEILQQQINDLPKKLTYKNILLKQQLAAEYEITQYKIKYHSEYLKNTELTNRLLNNLLNKYLIYYLIIIIVLASALFSEELNRGTISSLLTKPYPRWQIIIAKYLTLLIAISFVISLFLLFELGARYIFYPAGHLSPSYLYQHLKNQVIVVPFYRYLLSNLLLILPIIISLATLAFSISTIFSSKTLGLLSALLLVFMGEQLNQFIINNFPYLKYFLITFNWDFSQFLGGALPTYPGLTLLSSLVVIIIFNGGLLGITIYNFNNHNF